MKCQICNSELIESWTFCPYCGTKKASTINRGFDEVFQGLEKRFRDIFGSNFPADFPFGKGFKVEISQAQGAPKVTIKELEDKIPGRDSRRSLKGSKVLEPRVLVNESGRLLHVHLPLVKSDGDISIKKFRTSLEVKAKAGDIVYFTIIPLKKTQKLVKHEFRNHVLTLKFS